jgi:hypothetical protein
MDDMAMVPSEVQALALALAEPKPMRRGSLSERYVKCNKPGCPCAEKPEARHGPYYSVSRVVKGQTQSRWLQREQALRVREQVEAGHEFRKHIEAFWEACEQWADAELAAPEAALRAQKKGASKRSSTRSSSPRSKRS